MNPPQDIVHAAVLAEENGDGFEQLVGEAITVAGYPLQGVICDLGGGLFRDLARPLLAGVVAGL